ncbi:MAG TPA: AbrB/MazE/SpoVT family DNA-binding domain-containing protein [Thermoanaerobaculia bacterium]|nr:AbrB/MazE/SpoVT family DNA-binding domain-containing protein [Thermoanaerobaculia bacterium]
MNELLARIDSSGRLVVPAALRKELGLIPGAAVTLRVTDGELRVVARSEAVRLAQERVRKYVQPGRRLADELIAERRAEWKRG